MAPEKVTEMVLNVDLKCSGCYKKVKKVISKIPQIRDQVFDVEKNKVRIMVVCCNPEKVRDKLCYKGCGAIQSIEIIEKGEKPKEADKPKPAEANKPKPPAAADKPKEADKPKPAPADKPKEQAKPKPVADKPKEPEKPKPAGGDKPKDSGKPKEPEKPKPADKPKEPEKPKPADKPKDSGKPPEPEKAKPKDVEKPKDAAPPKKPDGAPAPTPAPAPAPAQPPAPAPAPAPAPNPDVAKMVYEPVHGYPQMYPTSAYPMLGYGQYYDQGYGGAPSQHGYGMPVAAPPPPPPSYGGFGYDHGYNEYNGNRGHYNNNDYGGHEEDGEGCSIM